MIRMAEFGTTKNNFGAGPSLPDPPPRTPKIKNKNKKIYKIIRFRGSKFALCRLDAEIISARGHPKLKQVE
jgi:hypothetical protein